ncbi:NAP1-related protein 2 [Cucumis melo var. makuwa]|uniref:NAP1-related protein 2 n=1 Tax=Cucumis melo var. makuwa TaxID=1194695 RepID=A0A5A7TX57_CUCMM|nr:NAP1-related protein 2 [Cucumis melo var. makuwa]
MLDDKEKFRNYPWGRLCFSLTKKFIQNVVKSKRKSKNSETESKACAFLQGFPMVLLTGHTKYFLNLLAEVVNQRLSHKCESEKQSQEPLEKNPPPSISLEMIDADVDKEKELPPPPPAYIRFFHPCRRLLTNQEIWDRSCTKTRRNIATLSEHRYLVIFRHLDSLGVEDQKDVKMGYSIMFSFNENPYFEDRKLEKTYTFFEDGAIKITGTTIKWKDGSGASNGVNGEKKGKKRPLTEDRCFLTPSFFIPSILNKVIGPEGLTMTLVLLGNRA